MQRAKIFRKCQHTTFALCIPLGFRWMSALMHKPLILLTLSLKDTQLRAFLNHAVYIVLLSYPLFKLLLFTNPSV